VKRQQIVIFLMALVCVKQGLAAELREYDSLKALTEAASCEIRQFDGLIPGGEKQDRFLVLLGCDSNKNILALIDGKYPISPSSDFRSMRLLDRRQFELNANNNMNLAAAICSKGRMVIKGTYAIIANWGLRSRVTDKSGLENLIGVTLDRNRFASIPLSGISCSRDEP
jgi:hypothetical protein